MRKSAFILVLVTGFFSLAQIAKAQEVWITPELPFFEIELNGEFIMIERNQDNEAVIAGAFAKTSRPCPPFCVHPMSAGEGIETVGEIEVLNFMEEAAINGNAYVVDARTPSFYSAGTIPGAVNLPFNLFSTASSNPFLDPLMVRLGAIKSSNGSWDFTNAPSLLLFCNGPWCDQSPRAIRNLILIGYPAEKLFYYRGGMQSWLMMGLTVVVP